MNNVVRRAFRYLNLLPAETSGPDLVASLAAIAMIQARVAADALRANVVPALPIAQRTFPSMVARRLETGDIFRQEFMADLDALADMLRQEIDAGAHVEWQADEHHVCGGYDVICYDPGVVPIVHAVNEIDDLRQSVLTTISAAQAMRSVEDLLAS